MKIKTKLILSAAVSTTLIFILLSVFSVTSNIVKESGKDHALAEEVNDVVSELNLLLNDYLLNREERTLKQWESRYVSGLSVLQNAEEEEEEEEEDFVSGIINDYLLLGRIFSEEAGEYKYMQKFIKEKGSQEKLSSLEELQKIRISRLLITSQAIASSANILQRESISRLRGAIDMNRNITLSLIIISFIAAIFILAKVSRDISRALYRLCEGTKIVGEGNLNYKIKKLREDEIGDLSDAFNRMTASLKNVTASKIALEREVSNRKTAERQLRIEREALQESEKKFHAVVETATDAIISSNSEGYVIFWNKAAEKMFGYKTSEVLGKSLTVIMPEEYRVAHTAGMKRLGEGGAPRLIGKTYEIFGLKKNGEKFPIELNLSVWHTKEGQFYTAIIRDIAERKKIEKIKSEFVSIASHQMKTPLTAISWIIERLTSGKVGKFSKKQKDYLNNVYDSSQRMTKLVDDLLSVSRLEEGKIKIEPKSLQPEAIIEEIIKTNKFITVKRQCHIIFDKPKEKLPLILFDESLMRQVAGNLLTNAIRYSKNGCRVRVKLEKKDNNFLLTISDEGIGIPKDKQHRVFEKFFRADNAQKMHPDGTGLGLYITKMIVELLGGKIWFESEEGKGTTFYVELPISL